MVKAVVYTSNSGYTRKYAEMLGEKLGVEAVALADAKGKVNKGDSVVYLGWLMAGSVQGLKKAIKTYDIKAVCGVGMAPPSDEERERVAKQNKMPTEDFFLLQGGFDMNKLHGLYLFMMKTMARIMSKAIGKKVEDGVATDMDKEMLEMVRNGKDCTTPEAVIPVADYVLNIKL